MQPMGEYEVSANMNTLAAQPVDPTTVDSLLTMCKGALDQVHQEIGELQATMIPVLRHGWDMELSQDISRPDANSVMGEQVSALYMSIVEAGRRIANLRMNNRI